MTRGQYKYIPKELVEYLDDYKKRFNLKDSDAMRKILIDSKIGHQIRINVDFNLNNMMKKSKKR